jgi:hypothetical protein
VRSQPPVKAMDNPEPIDPRNIEPGATAAHVSQDATIAGTIALTIRLDLLECAPAGRREEYLEDPDRDKHNKHRRDRHRLINQVVAFGRLRRARPCGSGNNDGCGFEIRLHDALAFPDLLPTFCLDLLT